MPESTLPLSVSQETRQFLFVLLMALIGCCVGGTNGEIANDIIGGDTLRPLHSIFFGTLAPLIPAVWLGFVAAGCGTFLAGFGFPRLQWSVPYFTFWAVMVFAFLHAYFDPFSLVFSGR